MDKTNEVERLREQRDALVGEIEKLFRQEHGDGSVFCASCSAALRREDHRPSCVANNLLARVRAEGPEPGPTREAQGTVGPGVCREYCGSMPSECACWPDVPGGARELTEADVAREAVKRFPNSPGKVDALVADYRRRMGRTVSR
jgi:hypothetical protein